MGVVVFGGWFWWLVWLVEGQVWWLRLGGVVVMNKRKSEIEC